jgi:pimeloyl-ACP methyl ester carboxylesterase
MTLDAPLADRLFTRVLGQGAAPALMLHCSQGHSGMFRVIASKLSDRFAMTAPDWPGHGKSAPWTKDQSFHDEATKIARALAKPGSLVIGHSFGATVALRLALEHPELVQALVLVEPVLFAAARDRADFQQHFADQRALGDLYRSDPEQATRLFNREWGGQRWDSFSPEVQQVMIDQMEAVLDAGEALWSDQHELLNPGVLEALTVPVRLLRGARSPGIIEDIHRTLVDRLPNATDQVIEGAGHMLVMSHPEAVSDAAIEAWSAR